MGLLGNAPPDALPPVELIFGEGGPAIYTYEDKTSRSGRRISHECPARVDKRLAARLQEISAQAFTSPGLL